MGFALAADVPVVLVRDIDRGHVIAALVGAKAVLDVADGAAIRGFIVNKFRGDPALFDDGRREIERRTGWPDLGLVPGWRPRVACRPRMRWCWGCRGGERAPGQDRRAHPAPHRQLRRLRSAPGRTGGRSVLCDPGSPLPGDADLIILPGSKATLSDLAFVRMQGWDIDIAAHVRRGGRVMGVCGGFQMLGRTVSDPDGIEVRPDQRRAWVCWLSTPF